MFPYTNYHDALFRQPSNLVSDVEKAVNGEYSAINCYSKIANLAKNDEERQRILEIRQDEIKHFQQFQQVYMSLTGRQVQPKIVEACPAAYLDGLEFALKDEQKTVDFYLEIADAATTKQIKEVFRRAAADEQNHAVWFLYYFTKNK
ncbi:ferritin-like domain-containing protein [Neobacillus niacini]|uniref:ferritin-like domain-containing protein n=1 Tax=Neobacillus niacini TaxID=86668 RepID=UPI00285B40D2|nr:ferritin-like domain-containing protein [Neobacillus niacini]MDR6999901.1 rubrerythrin [Neobacillus niacini]